MHKHKPFIYFPIIYNKKEQFAKPKKLWARFLKERASGQLHAACFARRNLRLLETKELLFLRGAGKHKLCTRTRSPMYRHVVPAGFRELSLRGIRGVILGNFNNSPPPASSAIGISATPYTALNRAVCYLL